VSLSVAGAADTTLTATNGASDQSRNAIIEITGVVTGNANVIVPTVTKKMMVFNNTSGAFTRTVKTAAGTGVLVPQGKKMLLYCDGVNVTEDVSAIGTLDIIGVLTARGALDWSKGANVASAATCNVWATDGNVLHITGATGPITSFGTAARAGAMRWVTFDATPTITNNANIVCLTGGNIIAAAGDRALIYAESTTVAWIFDYVRADGSPLALPATVPTLAGNNPFTGNNTFIRSDLTAPLLAGSTDAGAAEAVGLDLYRNSATAAANDLLESLLFSGNSVTPTKRTMAKLYGKLLTATNGLEDAELHAASIAAGVLADVIIFGKGGAYTPSVTDKGVDTINAVGQYMNGVLMAASDSSIQAGATHAPVLADHGKTFIYTNAGGCVVTLPAANTLFAGWSIKVVNASAGSVTFNRASTDTIWSKNTSLTSMQMPTAGDGGALTVDSTGGAAKFYFTGKRSFLSADIAIATSTINSQNHALGLKPDGWQFTMRCTVAQLGYSIGDEFLISGNERDQGSAQSEDALIIDVAAGVVLIGTATNQKGLNKGAPAAAVAIATADWVYSWRAWIWN
jgi:hypothetical protein